MVKLHVIYDYKSIYPELSGKALTDALIRRCLGREDAEIYRSDKGKPFVRYPEADTVGPFISVSLLKDLPCPENMASSKEGFQPMV